MLQEVSLKLWDVEVAGLHCGPGPAAWLSQYLGGGCLLIQHSQVSSYINQDDHLPRNAQSLCYQDEKTKRKARMKYLKTYPRTFPVTCIPGFADVTPYMMTTEPSLRDLRWSEYSVFVTELVMILKITAAWKYCTRCHTEDIQTKYRD